MDAFSISPKDLLALVIITGAVVCIALAYGFHRWSRNRLGRNLRSSDVGHMPLFPVQSTVPDEVVVARLSALMAETIEPERSPTNSQTPDELLAVFESAAPARPANPAPLPDDFFSQPVDR